MKTSVQLEDMPVLDNNASDLSGKFRILSRKDIGGIFGVGFSLKKVRPRTSVDLVNS